MNYKLIKRSYQTLAFIIISLCILVVVYIDTVTKNISPNLLMIISASLCFPFFALKLLHGQKYPPSKKQQIIGWIVAIAGLIGTFCV